VRLLVTVAHPDDESFGCGSVLAHATAAGIESIVVCATRGELGEVPGETLTRDELGRRREAELRAAAAILGVGRVEVLGWVDSGVDGEPAPGSLAAAGPAVVEAAIAAIVDEARPDVVITLDGSDGHRDHAIVRDATLAAIDRAAWRPARVYLWCLSRELFELLGEDRWLGTPDAELTTIVDVRRHLPTRWRAMRAHRSQTPPYDQMPADLQDAFLATDRLRRIIPPWTGGDPEPDWIPPTPAP
jgi:N-acetyl-1-D-myo-inositol-2-amino-2-deoxy-alpha-D-glucopyranoside deacetylase